MPRIMKCRNCRRKIALIYIEEPFSEMDEYCSEYCCTALEAPEALKYFKKPSWIKNKS